MFYQSYSRILARLRQPAILEPDDIGKSYIPQKKAQNRGTFVYLYLGLSFEVYDSFLDHFFQKLGAVKVQSVKNFHLISESHFFWHFEG